VVRRGKTPVLSAEEARKLLDSIETTTLIGLRDRAVIGVMVYSFARVGATVTMRVGDYFQHRKRLWLRLHEKGGKRHDVPCHPSLESHLNNYIRAAGVAGDNKGRLFRSMHQGGQADRQADDTVRRLPDDQAAGQGGYPPLFHLLPYISSHRHHDLSPERGHA
jgi:integrase